MLTDHREFNYEKPRMEYNRETGDVTIFEATKKKKVVYKPHDEVNEAK